MHRYFYGVLRPSLKGKSSRKNDAIADLQKSCVTSGTKLSRLDSQLIYNIDSIYRKENFERYNLDLVL